MVSDESFDELHAFARSIGLPRVAFQGDHYDLSESGRARAIAAGAESVGARMIVAALDRAGLRRGPALQRRGLDGVRDLGVPEVRTDRLRLRQWRPDDRDAFAAMSADPAVGDWLGGPLDRAQADAFIDHHAVLLALRGFGLWAVERTDTNELVGAAGLHGVGPEFPFGPALEVAWRLAPEHRGQGFATEAAEASLRYGAGTLDVDRIAAMTSLTNVASQRVMDRLGMRADESFPNGEFDHPRLAEAHPLRRNVLRWWTV